MDEQFSIPKVSIVTPARDAADTITTAINSVRSQLFSDWELLIVDDGSEDETANMVRKIMRTEKRIRLLEGGGNGVSVARNIGLEHARGRYVAFLDADDLYYPGSLGARVLALDEHDDWPVVYCPVELTDDDFQPLGWMIGQMQDRIEFADMHISRIHLNGVMGRADVMKGQHFHRGMTNGEDWLYVSRVLRAGSVFHQVYGSRVAYRIRSDSTVGQDYVAHENKLQEVLELIYGEDPGCFKPLPKYVDGIQRPPIGKTLLQRRCGVLTFLLLSGRADEARVVAVECQDSEFWPTIPEPIIEGSIKHAVARFYVCHTATWVETLRKHRRGVLEAIEDSGLKSTLPWFTRVLLEQLNGSSGSAQTNGGAAVPLKESIGAASTVPVNGGTPVAALATKPPVEAVPRADSPTKPQAPKVKTEPPNPRGRAETRKKGVSDATFLGRVKKIANTFAGRRGIVAAGTLVLMTLGSTDLPYSWVSTAIGISGLLVLIGQLAATKSR